VDRGFDSLSLGVIAGVAELLNRYADSTIDFEMPGIVLLAENSRANSFCQPMEISFFPKERPRANFIIGSIASDNERPCANSRSKAN